MLGDKKGQGCHRHTNNMSQGLDTKVDRNDLGDAALQASIASPPLLFATLSLCSAVTSNQH